MTTIYNTRTSRVTKHFSDAYFDFANTTNTLAYSCGGCIDAPEQLPSGSVKKYGKTDPFVLPTIHSRESENFNRSALATKLIAEVIAELNN